MRLSAILICTSGMLLGCAEKSNPEFEALQQKASNELQLKTAAHQAAWGFGKAERWSLNQEDGHLVFTFPEKVVTCNAQIIGSFDKAEGTWLWAWGNPGIPTNMTLASARVRQYGNDHGYTKLKRPEWKCSEEEAWKMSALAMLITDAQGVYRGPAGDSMVFITFDTPKIEKR